MTTAILLSAHGTVEDLAELPAFLERIRRRPTPQHLIDEVKRRFERIGGSPLLRITHEVARALEARLRAPVVVGMRLSAPTFEGALAEAARRGARRVVSLPLAPQSVAVYHAALREAAQAREGRGERSIEIVEAPPYGLHPALHAAFDEVIDEGLASFPTSERARVPVVLSAHSLPTRVIAAGDPYEVQFRAMAEAVIALRGDEREYSIAFQSQGQGGGDWLGPDLRAAFGSLATRGYDSVLVAAIGFVSDHVETLYDLDVEAPQLAAAAGLSRCERAPSLNARPLFLDALEAVVTPLLR